MLTRVSKIYSCFHELCELMPLIFRVSLISDYFRHIIFQGFCIMITCDLLKITDQ